MTISRTYCDRCKEEIIYPVTRRLYLSGIFGNGREEGFDLCDSCYEELELWFNGKAILAKAEMKAEREVNADEDSNNR